MNNNVSFLNLSGIECWIVNLLPFDKDNRNGKDVLPFQLDCIKKNIFGVGWHIRNNNYGDMTEESIKCYLKDYSEQGEITQSQKKAVTCFSKIRKGHYVIMRLRNSHYYIGRVKQTARYNDGIDGEYQAISWYCCVEKWVEFKNDEELPSEIVGRFSQKKQSTITRVGGDDVRLKTLIIQAYASCSDPTEKQVCTIPKIRLSEKNLSRSLNYRELEDLVSAHIYIQNPGYMLLPSSCKISRPNYEFTFVKAGCKPITCQVKNQKDVPVEKTYIDETSYEKIYLYSGTWTDEDVEKLKEKNKEYTRIIFISPSELFKTFKSFDYLHLKMAKYYIIPKSNDEEQIIKALTDAGWKEDYSFKKKDDKLFKVSEGEIYIGSNELHYSEELNSIVYTGTDYEDENVRRYIDNVISIINQG